MNICFFIGKVIRNIEYRFIVDNKKYYAIAIFQIELNNKSVMTVKGLNKIADYCYKNLRKKNTIIIKGSLNSKLEGIIEKLEILSWDTKK